VLVALHCSVDGTVKPSEKLQDESKDVFWQKLYREYTVPQNSSYIASPLNWTLANISGNPLVTIVDAFIARTALNLTYTNAVETSVDPSGSETVSITYDFSSGIDNSVEFVAWLHGHHHTDQVGYINGSTNMQLAVCLCSSNSIIFKSAISTCEGQDFNRNGGVGGTQDAINVYCIDRARKELRIAKIGATRTVELKRRDVIALPYKLQ
jgi:hypothetical protein